MKQLPSATYWSGSVIEIYDQEGDRTIYEPVSTPASAKTAAEWSKLGDTNARWGLTAVKTRDGDWSSSHAAPADSVTLTIADKAGRPLAMHDVIADGGGTVVRHQGAEWKVNLRHQQRGIMSPFLDLCHYVSKNVTGQVMTFWAIVVAVVLYVLVSLLGRQEFNMDRLLHRGQYATDHDATELAGPRTWLERLGIDREFTTADRWITAVTLAWPVFWTIVFVVLTTWRLTGHEISAETWVGWWQWWIWSTLGASIIVVTWFTIGGALDVRALFRRLRTYQSDERDDGRVVDHRNADEIDESA